MVKGTNLGNPGWLKRSKRGQNQCQRVSSEEQVTGGHLPWQERIQQLISQGDDGCAWLWEKRVFRFWLRGWGSGSWAWRPSACTKPFETRRKQRTLRSCWSQAKHQMSGCASVKRRMYSRDGDMSRRDYFIQTQRGQERRLVPRIGKGDPSRS